MNSSEERSSTELLANKTVASSLRFPSQVSNPLWIIVKLHVSRHGVNLIKLYPALAPAPAPCNYHCLWLEPEWRERIPLAPAGADYLFVLSCTGDSSQLVSIWLIISPLTHGNPNHQQHHQHYFYPFQSSSKCILVYNYEVKTTASFICRTILYDCMAKIVRWNYLMLLTPPLLLQQSQYWSEKVRDCRSAWALSKYFSVSIFLSELRWDLTVPLSL